MGRGRDGDVVAGRQVSVFAAPRCRLFPVIERHPASLSKGPEPRGRSTAMPAYQQILGGSTGRYHGSTQRRTDGELGGGGVDLSLSAVATRGSFGPCRPPGSLRSLNSLRSLETLGSLRTGRPNLPPGSWRTRITRRSFRAGLASGSLGPCRTGRTGDACRSRRPAKDQPLDGGEGSSDVLGVGEAAVDLQPPDSPTQLFHHPRDVGLPQPDLPGLDDPRLDLLLLLSEQGAADEGGDQQYKETKPHPARSYSSASRPPNFCLSKAAVIPEKGVIS